MALPRTERTIVRNTGVAALAPVLKHTVTFSYEDVNGKVTRRKNVRVTMLDTTGQAPGRAIIRTEDALGNKRSFRNDRVTRMVKGVKIK